MGTQDELSQMITLEDAARRLQVSENDVIVMINSKEIKGYNFPPNHVRVIEDEIDFRVELKEIIENLNKSSST